MRMSYYAIQKTVEASSNRAGLDCVQLGVGSRLKQLVYQVNPQIEQVKGDADTVRDALWDALEKAWHLIDENILDDLVGSMQRRVQAVIEAERWYTKY